MAPVPDKRNENRRRAPRVASNKRVLLARGAGASLLQEGVVSDVSRDGLGIVTALALPVGSSLEIEFTQGTDATTDPLFVRGRVVHVDELPDATYSIGVETLLTPNVRTASPHVQHAPVHDQATPKAPAVSHSARFAAQSHGPDRRKQLVPIVLVLLIPLAVGWSAANREHSTKSIKSYDMQPPTLHAKDRSESAPHERSGKNKDNEYASAQKGTASSIGQRQDLHDSGQRFERRPAPMTVEGVGDAVLVREESMPLRQRVDDFAAVPLKRTLSESGDHAAAQPDSPKERAKDSRPPKLPASVPETGVAVLIDKSAFSLTLYRNGDAVRTIPIAVGADDTTPTGVFTVANKLTNPVWHNRGEGVPAGDPRNPLGKRWLGLASAGKPTTYGIHAAVDTSKVGQPFGDGCLRLHPEDLETVFRICPVGTTVLIQP